ncbi:hypothetical protein CEE69_24435 [Rhodopirellula bahusiensis]|uniref:Uncharacterized protein n=1 Tax=Rhodopirellula bahusiensis TaxID=2014065 RepID=A0A2G1W158_9BACT|nr:hypothetical protein CEE69_24435 [Rhodopirellula bahusiensis]
MGYLVPVRNRRVRCCVVNHSLHCEPLETEPNPYRSPTAQPIGSSRSGSTKCPVCHHPVNRSRFVLPGCNCDICGRRLRLKNSWKASSLSTLTAIACFLSMLYFRAIPPENGILFGIHAFAFLILGTLWFHLFGKPALSTWTGAASATALARERERFRSEMDSVDSELQR